jgi:hypothetical protein
MSSQNHKKLELGPSPADNSSMRKKLLVLLFSPLFTGCYMKGNIQDMDITRKNILKGSAVEFNAGAKNIQVTNGNYQVSHAVGNPVQQIKTKTGHGYEIYVSVQGAVFSEQIEYENY